MKIKQVVDGKDVVAEVSEDTAMFMVDRGYATRVEEGVTETHEVAPSATPAPAPRPGWAMTPKSGDKGKA